MTVLSPEARALRIGYAGTPTFARVALQALLDAGATVPLVLTQPDRPAGRGLKLQASEVKQLALGHGIAVAQPRSLRLDGKFPDEAQAGQAALQAADLDVLVVAAYGLILPAWVLATPRHGCLNIHGSLLPRWRGAAPIHRAIEAGDAETGVTIMQMDEGLDTGAMLRTVRTPIGPEESTAQLHDRLAVLGAEALLVSLDDLAAGRLQPVAQPEAGVTYAHKIDKAEGQLDWTRPAVELARRVRAFDPFPGCSAEVAGQPVKLWRAVADDSPGAAAAPGSWRTDGNRLLLACGPKGEQALVVQELQRPGGRRIGAAEFLRGLDVR